MPRRITALAPLWLAGAALRLPILVLSPLLPLVHRDLGLSETAIGTLGSLPSLLFACAAIPGALLIARAGARQTLVAGLFIAAVGCALRGAATDIVALDLATIVMAGGIAVMQPALPPLMREWMPDRIGFGTALLFEWHGDGGAFGRGAVSGGDADARSWKLAHFACVLGHSGCGDGIARSLHRATRSRVRRRCAGGRIGATPWCGDSDS